MWNVLRTAGSAVVKVFRWAWGNPLLAAGTAAVGLWLSQRLKARTKYLESRGRINTLTASLGDWLGDVGITMGTLIGVTAGVSSLVPTITEISASVAAGWKTWFERFATITGVPMIGF